MFGVRNFFTEQCFSQRFLRYLTDILFFDIIWHGCMKGLDSQMPVNMGMKHRAITVTNDPLGMLSETFKIQPVDDPCCSIPST